MGLKQAKPTEDEFQLLLRFLSGLEDLIELRNWPGAEDSCADDTPRAVTAEAVWDWLQEQWRTVGPRWQRVLWAGDTAIRNACDPESRVLDWHPHLRHLGALFPQLVDPDACRLDHHGFCQTHFCRPPCPHGMAQQLLTELSEPGTAGNPLPDKPQA